MKIWFNQRMSIDEWIFRSFLWMFKSDILRYFWDYIFICQLTSMSDSKFNSFLEEELSQAPWTWNHIELLITLKHAMEIQKLCILFSKENSISNLFNTGTCFKPWQVCVYDNLKMVTSYSRTNNYIGFPENVKPGLIDSETI